MIRLTTPITEDQIRQLKVGDEVLLNGRVVLSRDMGHKYMKEQKPEWLKPILENMVIYHCGPVVKKHEDGHYSFVAAGPTTSIREEPYQADVIETYKVRGVIGKGGMGKKTSEGLQKTGAVYLHATGGAGSLLAERCKRVVDVKMLEEFGSPEAFWIIEVEDFPLVVTMDSHGGSLHEIVAQQSQERAKALTA
ncbi:FumA C-terminus/TtdB family hydratase beta subunit [Geothrix oryzisoli]|uniref:FumA C-terminus/TtdB family hydratase beta subunit n=1 Tax=Geothrix oryzisoli TaxID=2922721 RepID=UPI001FAD8DD8|nr:FumA C-terminus/TtdB family hydratase beta subunit [Geothrix oryzisoli]